jgi:hypothetical protein
LRCCGTGQRCASFPNASLIMLELIGFLVVLFLAAIIAAYIVGLILTIGIRTGDTAEIFSRLYLGESAA